MFLENFYTQYFNQPSGYTIPETIIFSLIFILAVWVLYRYFLERLDIEIDRRFVLSLVPFILFGGILRSLGPGDAGVFTGYWFDTPGIYLMIALLAVAALLASLQLEKFTELPYSRWMAIIGSFLCVFCVFFVLRKGIQNPTALALILGMVGIFAAGLYPVTRFFPEYLSKLNYGIVLAHLLDGSSAFVSVTWFGYAEKHVLPRFLFQTVGSWTMLPLKLGVVWAVLFLIDENVEDSGFKNWLKVAVLVLGLALGTRNLFSVAMGV